MDIPFILSLVSWVLAWSMSIGVLALGHGQRANRALAAFFGIFGLLQLGNLSASVAMPDPVSLGLFFVLIPATSFLWSSYLLVIATLDTPLVSRLKLPRARRAILVASTATALLAALVIGYGIATGVTNKTNNNPAIDAFVSVYFIYITAAVLATALFALFATVSAFRHAERGSLQRERARYWLLAFGTQDTLLVLAGATGLIGNIVDPSQNGSSLPERITNIVLPLAFIVSIPLLAYGIAKTQLFDIDLRVKWGAARGAVTAFLVAVFFVVEKLVESYASRVLGVTFGAVAAGLMLFFVPRLNRAADKVADKAAPKVQPTSEYVSFKKLEVYRAAVESALEEGGGRLDERGRGILTRLRGKLHLGEADAAAVEAEVIQAA